MASSILVAEAAWTYMAVRRLLRRIGAERLASAIHGARNRNGGARRVVRDDPARVQRAVERVLRVLPDDSRCLTRSLVLVWMLERRGIVSRVVIGVRPKPNFAAHAWVETSAGLARSDEVGGFRRIAEL